MTRIINRAKIEFSSTITLSEIELRALDALVGYGVDSFLARFYTVLGKSYLEPHEAGIRSLFQTIGLHAKPALLEVNQARRILAEAERVRYVDRLLDEAVKAEGQ